MSVEIDEGIARRVLEVVDAGLVRGVGEPIPGQMCAAAAVCYALGLPHGDEPSCVSPAVRPLMIRLNDARWSSPSARARGLRRLAIAALGSAGTLDEGEFSRRAARLAIQTFVSTALRAEALRHAGVQRERLLQVADLCEREPTREHAWEAATYARAAAYYAAYYAAAAEAAAYADAAAAAADRVGSAATYAVDAVYATAEAVHGNDAKARAAYDATLGDFAERVVCILHDMGSPGAAYLYLTGCLCYLGAPGSAFLHVTESAT